MNYDNIKLKALQRTWETPNITVLFPEPAGPTMLLETVRRIINSRFELLNSRNDNVAFIQ